MPGRFEVMVFAKEHSMTLPSFVCQYPAAPAIQGQPRTPAASTQWIDLSDSGYFACHFGSLA